MRLAKLILWLLWAALCAALIYLLNVAEFAVIFLLVVALSFMQTVVAYGRINEHLSYLHALAKSIVEEAVGRIADLEGQIEKYRHNSSDATLH